MMLDHIHGIIEISDVNDHTFKWQRSFYDRIIRTERESFNIRNYIKNNAQKHTFN
jgi:hypothetical protein